MRNVIIVFTALIFMNCQQQSKSARIDLGALSDKSLYEVSGIACSEINPALIWSHNDSGDEARIFALDNEGKIAGSIKLDGIEARDWEDIATGPGPDDDQRCIFVGDIGDNRAQYDLKYIHRFPEPLLNTAEFPSTIINDQITTITYRYPDGRRDAEALMVDPISKDIFIVSKREEQVGLYRLPFPQSADSVIIAEKVLTLNMTQVTAADIAPSGKHILIKTYPAVYYWSRPESMSVDQALQTEPVSLHYVEEPQGEAISWHPNENGYYTISEERDDIKPHLYFYPFE